MIIYFDMDGVLTNFKPAIIEFKSQHPNESAGYDFWITIPEIPIRNVVDTLKSEGYQLGIISKLPEKEKHQKGALAGKAVWLEQHYDDVFEPVYITAGDKTQFCQPGDILIDNKKSNIDSWNSAGGIGILFDGYTESSSELLERIKKAL